MSTAVIPLESNPEIFSNFGTQLGLIPRYAFYDIFSLDSEMLSLYPRPNDGVILLFPVTREYEEFKAKETPSRDVNVNWYKQKVKNACGLYALLHILTNLSKDHLQQDQNNILDRYEKSQESIDELIQDVSKHIYNQYAVQGETEAPSAEEDITLHFITFVKNSDGRLIELDGRRDGPIDLGALDESNMDILDSQLLKNRIETYMGLVDEENRNNFALMGLGPID
ncbi:BA75_03669T0 [Komagataella pastoris]|uniref:Ubiquitin carboxyl-terminal hydrolase n=1 Tax=Komagataella pastoris TaxID=4922 RepID=A0A1B2JG73_PICPA|nr:BA75_03669T0 [Komagataella pastoris]